MTNAQDDTVARLTARVRTDLSYLDYPPDREWTKPRFVDGQRALDVLIIGGGQSGLVTAFALRQERVSNILIVDRQPRGLEGPWNTYARMPHLRTPKAVTGPDLGIPSLTPRAWYEARFGAADWNGIAAIPRPAWHEYLRWYRETLSLEVENDTTVETVEPVEQGLLAARVTGPRGGSTLFARKIVFATGLEGSGVWRIPTLLTEHLPPAKYAHASATIEFSMLQDRRVAILGAGASAFDNALAALTAGAAQVDLFVRRSKISEVNPLYWMNFSGVLGFFYDLPDLHRWRFGRHLERAGTPPPPNSVARCVRFANFAIRLGEPWTEVADASKGFSVTTPKGHFAYDFVISATGADQNPQLRPELATFAREIALWRDRLQPPAEEDSETLGSAPISGRPSNSPNACRVQRPGCATSMRRLSAASPAWEMSAGRHLFVS